MNRNQFFACMVPSVPKPDAWLDAKAITGLSDGDAVATWTDKTGNGNSATQATAGYRPIYKTGIINGLPTVRFNDATMLAFPLGLFRNIAGASIFVAARILAKTGTNNAQIVYMVQSGVTILHFKRGDSGDYTKLYTGIRRISTDSAAIALSSTGELQNDTNYILGTVLNYSSGGIAGYKNGSLVCSNTFGTTGNTADADADRVQLGNTNSPPISDASFFGYMGEVMIYKRAVSAVERTRINNYLMRKWGIG